MNVYMYPLTCWEYFGDLFVGVYAYVYSFSILLQTEWIMLARSQSGMTRWIDGINAQIHALFIREHKISEDDYLNEG